MELVEFLKENGFTELRSNENVNHQVFNKQHTLVSIWNESVTVSAYGRVNYSGKEEDVLNYLQNLNARGVSH